MAHPAKACPGFHGMKRWTRSITTPPPPGWDACLTQGYSPLPPQRISLGFPLPVYSLTPQDLISNSPYCLPYSSYDVSLENLVLD